MQQSNTLPRLTYVLNGTTREVSNLTQGLSKIHLVTELESGEVFYRTKWKGDISFVGDDFRLLWSIAQKTCCQTIPIVLYRNGQSCDSSAPYWKGVFNLSDLEFDFDGCIAKLSQPPHPDDGYQTLLENWEKQVNWLEIDSVHNIFSADRTILYRRGRTLTRLLSGLTAMTLRDTPAASLIPTIGPDTISVFLENPVNPVTHSANTLYGALCIQASDFMAPGEKIAYASPDFATKAEVSLKAVVEDLKALLQLYPYIDATTGKLRWEHVSFFPGLTYDVPAVTYSLPDSNPVWKGKRSVKTDINALYGTYKLTIETNARLTSKTLENAKDRVVGYIIPPDPVYAFNVGTIDFTDACVTRLPGETPLSNEVSASVFCTAPFIARAKAQYVSKEDWIFLVGSTPSTDPANAIPQIPVVPTGGLMLPQENGDLSAASLVRDFHRHNQPFASGLTDVDPSYLPGGIRRGMLSVSRVRQLGAVSIPYCCGDNPVRFNGLIETWLASDGVLVSADYDVAAQLLKLEFSHPGPCQIPGYEPPPGPIDPNCPAKGTYLRVETEFTYSAPDPISHVSLPCAVTVRTFYADGQCGEYHTTDFKITGTC